MCRRLAGARAVQRAERERGHKRHLRHHGQVTSDAIAFAGQVGTTLVDGPELLCIIGAGLTGMPFEVPLPIETAVPTCPACGADMVQRAAHRGAHAGELFWGSSTFPAAGQRANSMPNPSAPTDLIPASQTRARAKAVSGVTGGTQQ